MRLTRAFTPILATIIALYWTIEWVDGWPTWFLVVAIIATILALVSIGRAVHQDLAARQ